MKSNNHTDSTILAHDPVHPFKDLEATVFLLNKFDSKYLLFILNTCILLYITVYR